MLGLKILGLAGGNVSSEGNVAGVSLNDRPAPKEDVRLAQIGGRVDVHAAGCIACSCTGQ